MSIILPIPFFISVWIFVRFFARQNIFGHDYTYPFWQNIILTQTRVGSKGHWSVMLEEVKLEKMQWVSKFLPSKRMDLRKEMDKPKAEANPSKPARKLKNSRTHICMENTRTLIKDSSPFRWKINRILSYIIFFLNTLNQH